MLVRATINIGGLEAGEVGEMDDALARRRMAKGWVVPAEGDDDGGDVALPEDEPAASGSRGQTMRASKSRAAPDPSL